MYVSVCLSVCLWSMICESSLNFRKMSHGKSLLHWQWWIQHFRNLGRTWDHKGTCSESQVSEKEWNCWSREAPHVWWTSHGQVEVERRLKVADCVVHVPVFLALGDQMMGGEGWWSNTLSPWWGELHLQSNSLGASVQMPMKGWMLRRSWTLFRPARPNVLSHP